MSYDFYAAVDTAGAEPHHIEPYFDDVHPAFFSDGMAGTAIQTPTGHARCGNYTSNVSRIWAKCLTAALDVVPDARKWIGADDHYCIEHYGPTYKTRDRDTGELVEKQREVATDELRLADLQSAPMGELVPLITAAVEWGVAHIDELHEFDPPNGWGNADGAVTYLWDIQRFCEMHPNATLHLSH